MPGRFPSVGTVYLLEVVGNIVPLEKSLTWHAVQHALFLTAPADRHLGFCKREQKSPNSNPTYLQMLFSLSNLTWKAFCYVTLWVLRTFPTNVQAVSNAFVSPSEQDFSENWFLIQVHHIPQASSKTSRVSLTSLHCLPSSFSLSL